MVEERIVRQACTDVVPDKFVEAGCCVCGQLTLLTDLQKISDLADVDLNILHEDGVTRAEHSAVDEPIVGLSGPVIDDTCDSAMHSGKRPLKSLANRLWIGRVPWQLKDLSFAERMLITRVRHNWCVVRVSSGHGKLSADAIMFTNPTVQVYNILPPSSDEISEVLAFAALDWLKLNHCDYADLLISKENMEALPEYGMPFGVDWKPTTGDESSLSPEQRSVDDGGVETEGTSSGKYEYGSATIRTLKAKTLDHLANNGQTLGFENQEAKLIQTAAA
ncbi:hypothetical protein C8J57DRAFT_1440318 [Mycena rebaudengoi]|nr:hypothetical protein C8J57DRAFT_1440318 [Mycena rebaudengoi]